MLHLYVYYTVEERHCAALLGNVAAIQRRLGEDAGRRFFLRRRKDAAHGTETWMEVYEHVLPDFELQLEQAVSAAAMDRWISGARHLERFD